MVPFGHFSLAASLGYSSFFSSTFFCLSGIGPQLTGANLPAQLGLNIVLLEASADLTVLCAEVSLPTQIFSFFLFPSTQRLGPFMHPLFYPKSDRPSGELF